MSLDAWRRWTAEWLPEEAIPDHPELGLRYPWRQVATHRVTRAHRRVVDQARRYIAKALDLDRDWRVGVSCGKDSTALALLLAEEAGGFAGISVKDDLDYPGERAYLEALERRTGHRVEVLEPKESLRAFLKREGVSLVEELHSRAAELSSQHFYGLLDEHRARAGHDGVILGLRGEESRGRRLNLAMRGPIYRRDYDGLWVAQPLANWSALDVHAFCLSREVPLLPLYLCIDPEMDAFRIRKSWWVAGGGPARYGHYVWLRRWWPMLWEIAVDIDPEVAQLS